MTSYAFVFFCERTKCRQVFSSGWICEVILQFCRYYLILIRSHSCQKHEIFFLRMWTCKCPELENNFQLSLAESYNFFEQNLDQNQGRLFLFHHNIRSIYLDFRFCEMNYYCHIKCVIRKNECFNELSFLGSTNFSLLFDVSLNSSKSCSEKLQPLWEPRSTFIHTMYNRAILRKDM